MSEQIMVQSSVLNKMRPEVRLPFRDACAAYKQAHGAALMPRGVVELRIAALERRFVNPTITIRDAVALRDASIAEATAWKEYHERQEQPR